VAVGALRVNDIALASANLRFAPRLFDLPAKGKVRFCRISRERYDRFVAVSAHS
jgi:hypothetical protein